MATFNEKKEEKLNRKNNMAKKKVEEQTGSKLSEVLKNLNKSIGAGTIMRMNDAPSNIEAISTGIIPLDTITGINGIAKGRLTLLRGDSGSSKSSHLASFAASVQKQGGTVALIDTEFSMDPNRWKQFGVDPSQLIISQPTSAEDAMTIIYELVKTGEVDLVMLDSIAAMLPRSTNEAEFGQAQIGVLARIMSQALQKLIGIIGTTKTSVVMTNQVRDNINSGPFAGGKAFPGGRASAFYSSQIIDLARIQTLKKGEEAYGIKIRAKMAKNRFAPPFQQIDYILKFDETCFDAEFSLVELAIEKGILKKSGAWISYEGNNIAQGLDKAAEYLRTNKEFCDIISDKIKGIIETTSPEIPPDIDPETGEILEAEFSESESEDESENPN